ncbi:MAG: hypothetical protein ACKPKO_40630, partial [Candidatus Fonsibacter sp.]
RAFFASNTIRIASANKQPPAMSELQGATNLHGHDIGVTAYVACLPGKRSHHRVVEVQVAPRVHPS